MRVLVIGGGGREHALCWKLRQSPLVDKLFCAPGNAGSREVAENVGFKVEQTEELAAWAAEESIGLTVVGPELPLTLGIANAFARRGLRIFGPSMAAAQLEASKHFAKEVMRAAGVPTASYEVFDSHGSLLAYLRQRQGPIVLKADGLAAGKGVFVCSDTGDAEKAALRLFTEFAASTVVAEEFLRGVEASLIVATDGSNIVPLLAAHDYKRIGTGDTGPNTGGMGSVCPTDRLTKEGADQAIETIVRPVLAEMARRGTPFLGFLYAGLMIDPNGQAQVLEFNVRLGDPETQAILPLLESDLCELLVGLCDGKPLRAPLSWKGGSAVCLVLAAPGYPDDPRSGQELKELAGYSSREGVMIFHAGTRLEEETKCIAAGGRVLNVVGMAHDTASARAKAYGARDAVAFPGSQSREDIGA